LNIKEAQELVLNILCMTQFFTSSVNVDKIGVKYKILIKKLKNIGWKFLKIKLYLKEWISQLAKAN